MADYKFVDFCHAKTKWVRVSSNELVKLVESNGYNNCFTTIQQFANKEHLDKEELSIAPLYFDLDSTDLEEARLEALEIVEFFKGLEIDELAIRVWFSGSRGFHITISPKVFAIAPANYGHRINKIIASYIKYWLEVKNVNLKCLDEGVYTSRRMWRVPNTRHATTGLYKVELTHSELKLNAEDIKELAVQPRTPLYETRIVESAERYISDAAKFYSAKKRDFLDMSTFKRTSDVKFKFKDQERPLCVEHLLSNKWASGYRNNTTMQLAAYFKEAGTPESEAAKILCSWVKEFNDDNKSLLTKLANTKSVVKAIYENDYCFGCAFIRSAKTEDSEVVPCAGTLCKAINTVDIDDEKIEVLNLVETGRSEHTGKMIKTKVMVAGKKSTPYIVPNSVKYICYSKCDKKGCPLMSLPKRTAVKEFTTKDRALLQMCGVADTAIKIVLREQSGIHKCTKYEIEILSNVNIEELLVIPKVEDDDEDNDYVLRKVYSIGNMEILENRYYLIAGYVYPHPKNQEGTIIVESVKPLQDVIESFKYNNDVHVMLSEKFGCKPEIPAIRNKLKKIFDGITFNVTGIIDRDEVLFGLMLAYHSALKIKLPWDDSPTRGWVEVLVVGDTGTGKSALIDKFMRYISIGTKVNAESTSRTGLTYKMEQATSGTWYIVWGAWPLSDKEFLWIDEASAIPKDEYAQMTLARSEGKLEVKRAVTAETSCRVRSVLTTNAVKGKRLSDYVHGAESLKPMFNNEDIRRFDFALFMKATDVSVDRYNTVFSETHEAVTSDELKANILFAWSRTDKDVVFTDAAVDEMLKSSKELSNLFGNATDIPLVSPSDQRNKIARLSASLALILHNTDSHNIGTVVVEAVHVEYIRKYLLNIYNGLSCGLRNYAKTCVKEETLSIDKFEKLRKYVSDRCMWLLDENNFSNFVNVFTAQAYIRLGELEAVLNLDKHDTKLLVQVLTQAKMIVTTTSGFRKTPRFNSFIEMCFKLDLVSEVDNGDVI